MDGFETGEIGVGVVTGIRRWRLDDLGWLQGISYREQWAPGENVAVHGGNGLPVEPVAPFTTTIAFDGRGNMIVRTAPAEPGPECLDLSCGSCGYYGYFDGCAQYGSGGVTGIIEGYGHVIIGTKGFRAQKARIVALCPAPARSEGLTVGGSMWSITWDSAPLDNPPGGLALMGRNYPEIPIFADEAAMLAAHPTDEGTEPPPNEKVDHAAQYGLGLCGVPGCPCSSPTFRRIVAAPRRYFFTSAASAANPFAWGALDGDRDYDNDTKPEKPANPFLGAIEAKKAQRPYPSSWLGARKSRRAELRP